MNPHQKIGMQCILREKASDPGAGQAPGLLVVGPGIPVEWWESKTPETDRLNHGRGNEGPRRIDRASDIKPWATLTGRGLYGDGIVGQFDIDKRTLPNGGKHFILK